MTYSINKLFILHLIYKLVVVSSFFYSKHLSSPNQYLGDINSNFHLMSSKKGFGSINNSVKTPENSRYNLEQLIQSNIDKVAGLKEAMKLQVSIHMV
jgi:hypothetical protein